MALTPEEELELEQLKKEYDALSKEYEVFKNPIQKPETGFLESAARGAAQGLTFDMADELTALAENTITGKPYEQALAESRAEYKAAEEEYPITTGLTGLAGGIAQGVGLAAATGGAGAAAGAAGAASKIGKLAKTALLPTVGKGALKNIGSAALSGATYGALQEYGASEKKGLEALEEVPMAAVTGAGIGGALGAAAEGVGKGVKSLSGFVSKQLDEGNLPRSFEKIRDLYRSGLKGKGYIASKETDRINKQVEDASKNAVDVIQKSLDDVREIKNTILNKVDQPIEVQSTLNKLRDDLILKAEEGLSDSPKALLRVEGLIKSKLIPEESTISAISANDLINKLEDYVISNPESSAEIKKLLRDSINELKLNLRISLDPSDVYEVLKDRPDILKKYEYYVKDLTDEALKTGSLSEYEKEFFKQFKKPSAKQKQETEKELAETIKQLRKGRPKLSRETKLARAVEKLSEEEVQNILKDAGVILKESSKTKPLGQLDSLMHHILNASENLGGVTRADGTDLKRKFKIFDVLRGNTADTGTGQKAAMKYEEAISELEKANTKIAKNFKDVTEDAIKELDNKKFLEGSKLGEGPRDSSALRQLVTAPAVATGLAANLAAQVSKRPEAGILRPTVAYLNSLKNKINDRLIVEPDNVFYKRISQGLDDAINQKDETRRAAIMNTLMQYESVRKMLKEENE